MLTGKQKQLIKNIKDVKLSAKTRTEYNAYQQMLTRIRRFGHGAVEDLLFLIEELPEEELKKIVTLDLIKDLIKVILKPIENIKRPVGVLDMDTQTGQISRVYSKEEIEELERFTVLESLLQRLIRQSQKCILPERDLDALSELSEKYSSPARQLVDAHMSDYQLKECHETKDMLERFVQSHGLWAEYELWGENMVRERLRESGWSEEKINNYFKK